MMNKCFIVLLFILAGWHAGYTQAGSNLKWWDPASASFPVIEGRGWQHDLVRFYDRLPAKAEKSVRPDVWRLSQNTAGEYIRFRSDASEIVIRYTIAGQKNMDHMPSTGVSGVDLYALDQHNKWHWVNGRFRFDDTVTYTFSNIVLPVAIKEFRLYLPLYNSVKWMQVGVSGQHTFAPLPASTAQPVVVYGTSIMQGACASRPGLAWTNILGRKLNVPVINLGFSGNGRLEQPLIDLLNETNARLFVLDCQPNLTDRNTYSDSDIRDRILNSVKRLQSRHPQTPVLLVEHCCGSDAVNSDTSLISRYKWTSQILARTFAEMQRNGVKNIYLLSTAELKLDGESTVDGTHPNDIGMMKYALAYEKMIRKILGSLLPVPQ